jgi:hypothetical protein
MADEYQAAGLAGFINLDHLVLVLSLKRLQVLVLAHILPHFLLLFLLLIVTY